MNILNRKVLLLILSFVLVCNLFAQDERSFKIFQFPPNMIPTIDGQTVDWDMVPKDYVVGIDQLWDDSKRHPFIDTTNLNVSVKVGWVKGLNRLYFLYEAYDDYWDYSDPGLHNDTYELVVDGDQSGGPFLSLIHI